MTSNDGTLLTLGQIGVHGIPAAVQILGVIMIEPEDIPEGVIVDGWICYPGGAAYKLVDLGGDGMISGTVFDSPTKIIARNLSLLGNLFNAPVWMEVERVDAANNIFNQGNPIITRTSPDGRINFEGNIFDGRGRGMGIYVSNTQT